MGVPLSQIKVNHLVKIVNISNEENIKHRLVEMGIRIGSKITVISKSDNGLLIIAMKNMRLIIGKDISENIIVEGEKND